jgi:hypothetical protein
VFVHGISWRIKGKLENVLGSKEFLHFSEKLLSTLKHGVALLRDDALCT